MKSDELIIFLHGLACSKQQFQLQTKYFDQHYRTLTMDFLGHGEAATSRPPTFSDLLEQTRELVLKHKGTKVHLVGHSVGAAVALQVASQAPVASVVMLDPIEDMRSLPQASREKYLPADPGQYKKLMQEWWGAILKGSTDAVKQLVFKDLWNVRQETFQSIFLTSMKFDPVAAFGALSCPVLNLYTEINNTPHSLRHVLPELDSELFSGVSHWLHLDAPTGVNKRIKAFLSPAS